MSKNCSIMKRMKENYESRSRTYLTRRMPVIMRIDGKAFHTYTKGLDRPFDEGLMEDMVETAKYLCSQIQGAKDAYVQSDEISILLTDYDKLTTNAWFDYQVQKMCSVGASMAASKFNQLRYMRASREHYENKGKYPYSPMVLADFDCRAFNIPKEEVANYFLARQKDAVKNSISMLAQSLYSHTELHKKNQSEMQEMCFQKGINWNDLEFGKKRGTFVVRVQYVNGELNIEDFYKGMPKWKEFKEGWAEFDIFAGGYVIIEKPTVRSKWEAAETPMTFSEEDFKQWL